jgi:hypothetical protein
MYHQVQHSEILLSAHRVLLSVLWLSEQTSILVFRINRVIFVIEMECVYCAVRTESLYIIAFNLRL